MFQSLLLNIAAGIGGMWIATTFIPNVEFRGSFQLLLTIGIVFGIINAIVKPFLNLLTLPIRILTLGLSSFLINILLVWLLDILFGESLDITTITALFWTTLILLVLRIPLSLLSRGKI